MRMISAPARAECELDHRFMPSAEYSHCVDEAGGPEEQAVARGFDEAAALLFDVIIRIRRARGQRARSRPSDPSSSAPIRREYSATSAARIAGSRRSPGAGRAGSMAPPCTARRALSKRGAGRRPFRDLDGAPVARLEKRPVVARAR